MGLCVQYLVILTKAKSGMHNGRQLKQEGLDEDSNNSIKYICLSTALNEMKDYWTTFVPQEILISNTVMLYSCGKPQKTSVWKADLWVRIWTRDLLNIKQECYSTDRNVHYAYVVTSVDEVTNQCYFLSDLSAVLITVDNWDSTPYLTEIRGMLIEEVHISHVF